LIYNLSGSWLYQLSGWIGLRVRSLYLMQTANCFIAGAAVILLYRCLRIQGWSREHGLIVAWIFGFSATWWKFATDADGDFPPALRVPAACESANDLARGLGACRGDAAPSAKSLTLIVGRG